MDAVAPAKAILSGEHSVVYGAPALAVAVRRYARCRVETATGFHFKLRDLGVERTLDLGALTAIHRQCAEHHRQFVAGAIPVDRILSGEGDLLVYALVEWLGIDRLAALPGLAVDVASQIPVGAGMGSSAAIVAALLTALSGHLDLPLEPRARLVATRNAEQLQHGRSSGIDPAVCCRGGAIRFDRGDIQPLALSLQPHWYLADTGRPAASTGVCCEQVRRGYGDSVIWSEFADVTDRLAAALQALDSAAILRLIRINHRLLCRIGVVPAPVQTWIAEVEASGGAAKISGAGSVDGEGAGLVLVYHPERPLPLKTGPYSMTPMEIDYDGARLRN